MTQNRDSQVFCFQIYLRLGQGSIDKDNLTSHRAYAGGAPLGAREPSFKKPYAHSWEVGTGSWLGSHPGSPHVDPSMRCLGFLTGWRPRSENKHPQRTGWKL